MSKFVKVSMMLCDIAAWLLNNMDVDGGLSDDVSEGIV